MRKRIVFGLIGAMLLFSTGRAADQLPPRAELIPSSAVLVWDVSDTDPFLDLLLSPGVMKAVKASPEFKAYASKPDYQQLVTLVEYFETQLDAAWQKIPAKVLAGGFTLAVGPENTVLLIVDADNEETLQKLHTTLQLIAKGDASKKGNSNRVTSHEYGDVTTWTFGPGEHHAIVGNRLVLSNKSGGLKDVLDRYGKAKGENIAESPAYKTATQAAGTAASMLYVNSGVLKRIPGIETALKQDKNPLGTLLLAGLAEAVQESTWLAVGLDVEDNTLVARLATDGKADPSGKSAFGIPGDGRAAAANLSVPRRIAAVSLHRDMHGFYASKDDLFPERTSEIIFFENMMGIFFTGRDLTDEVLGQLDSDVRLVVAGQKYDDEVGTPAVQIPPFALVFHMKDPEAFSRVAEEAWQKGLGLINFTRGQKALPGLIIDRKLHDGVKYTVSYFAPPEKKDRAAVDMRYNLRPSLATYGEYLILSSTDALTEDLMDALADERNGADAPAVGTHSIVEIDGPGVAAVLAANREALIANTMIEKGNSRQHAESEIDTLLLIAKYVGLVRFNIGQSNGQTRATLTVKMNLPR